MAHTRHFSDEIQQQFPFKAPLLKYIFENINYKHLHKLYQCCKLFPNKFPLIIIHEINDKISSHFFCYNSQGISHNFKFSKIWVSDKLKLENFQFRSTILQWMSKIMICTIKSIQCKDQDLSLNDFTILTHNETVESLDIRNVIDENGMPLSVDEIVAFVPNANRIKLSNAQVTPETFTELAAIERKCKISFFELFDVNVVIDSNEILTFIKIHASNKHSKFIIHFDPEFPADYVKNLHIDVKTKIYFQPQFKKFTQKPCFCSMVGIYGFDPSIVFNNA